MGKHIKKRTIYAITLSVMLFCAVLIAFLLLFQVRKIEVEGNKYLMEHEVRQWIQNDDWAANSISLIVKYNLTEAELLPALEDVKIGLKNPWTVSIRVKEKNVVGYLIVDDDFVYFDEDGIVLEKSREWRDELPCIEGLSVKKVELFKELPIAKKDKNVFKYLKEMTAALEKYELSPKKVVCHESQLYLYFDNKCVSLGNSNFAEKISQIPPILDKLGKKKGTLHLENYDESNTTISFEKGVLPKLQKKKKKEKTDKSE